MKVSIIIPFRDNAKVLRKCISSIRAKSFLENCELILVDNNSTEVDVKDFLLSLSNDPLVRILHYSEPFNFSAINNFAIKHARGEFVLFLNNDTEVISRNWIEEMVKCFDDDKIGAVGAKLLYPNGTIQHAGVMLEEKRLAIHAFRTWKESDVEFNDVREWSAVTAACMMTKKDLFEKVGGFDEINLPIAYNDVDYCLKIRELGYKIICTPSAKLYHYESTSRKSDVWAKIFNRKRHKQFLTEQRYMRDKWSKQISSDPFYKEEYI